MALWYCLLCQTKGYALISGHPGGVTLGKYEGMVQDLSTLFVNFKPWMGGLDCFCTFVAGSPGEDARDL